MRRPAAALAVALPLVLAGCSSPPGADPDRSAPPSSAPPATRLAPDAGSPQLERLLASAVPAQDDLSAPDGWQPRPVEVRTDLDPVDPCDPAQLRPAALPAGVPAPRAQRSGRVSATAGGSVVAVGGSVWDYADRADAEAVLSALRQRASTCRTSTSAGLTSTWGGLVRRGALAFTFGWERTASDGVRVSRGGWSYSVRDGVLMRASSASTGDRGPAPDLEAALRGLRERTSAPLTDLVDSRRGTDEA